MRPYQDWKCTRESGFCEKGPDKNGLCPFKKNEACNPKLNIRAQRFLFSFSLFTFLVGIFFLLNSQENLKIHAFNPGPVSNPHQTFEKNCLECHGDNSKDLSKLKNIHKSNEGSKVSWQNGKVSTQACLNCHNIGDHPHSPHGMSQDMLVGISEKYNSNFNGNYEDKSCVSCHKEHQGRMADISHLSDSQCQSCHQVKFKSFAEGHSDFKNYPYKTRTKIKFNHLTHKSKHFPESKQNDFQCASCHGLSEDKTRMVSKGFNDSCVKCHENQVYDRGKSEKGWVILGLPYVDMDTLKAKSVNIGSWPEDAEGEITEFFKFLMTLKIENRELIEWVEENGLDDLSDLEKEDLNIVKDFVWAFKQTLFELSYSEENDFLKSVKNSLAESHLKMGKVNYSELAVLLDKSKFSNMVKDWFPNLKEEMEAFLEGKSVVAKSIPSTDKETESDIDFFEIGGVYHLNEDFTLRYRPKGHGDSSLKAWYDFSALTGNLKLIESLDNKGTGAGSCFKCHSMDKTFFQSNSGDSFQINWFSKKNREKSFSKFNHRPHLGLIGNNGCINCHQLKPDSKYEESFSNYDPKTYDSNFSYISKSTCIECHKSEKDENGACLTCHNYHIQGNDFMDKVTRKSEKIKAKSK